MKSLIRYISLYFYEVDRKVFTASTLLVAALICINYTTGLDRKINKTEHAGLRLLCSYGIFLFAFLLPYFFYWLSGFRKPWKERSFIVLLFIAPMIFAVKHQFVIPFDLQGDPNEKIFWEYVIYWPLLVLMVSAILYLIWKIYRHPENFYGLTMKGLDFKPYLLMLLAMMPLVAAASTQPDFLAMYPKLKLIGNSFDAPWMHKFVFELSYGSDFFTIELFFRGFLVLAFTKWAGREVILPMACFYCTIHFGKPVAECISSYFGGLLLGIVVFHTRSILGGLLVHLGIAWMMEAGGWIGNVLKE